MKQSLLLFFATCFFFSHAQNADQYDATVANHYFEFTLKLTKEEAGFTPPVASRAFGYTGLALYEAIVPGIPSMNSTVGAIPGFTNLTSPDANANYHWPVVANNTLAAIIDSLWGNATQVNKDSLHAIRDHYNSIFQSQISAQDFEDSKSFGEAIANDIFEFSKTDGGHNCYTTNFPPSYTPPSGVGLWVPLANQTALQPYWGNNRPFVTADTTSVIPGPPPAFSTLTNSIFYAYAFQVYYQVNHNSADQVTIAQYWADGGGTITPPGHSISMLHDVLVAENADLEFATIAYAKLGMAVSDAFVACWKTKYIYNLLRPITYIQNHIDPNWFTIVSTPPFPEYSSGHSSQSGAMAAIMESLYGTSYAFTDSAHGSNFGGPRSYNSFAEAAEEAAISRLYGGIHYEFSNTGGLNMGRAIGQNVNELFDGLVASVANTNTASFQFEVYPNPATDIVSFYTKGFNADQLEVYNTTGQLMTTGRISSSQLNVAGYAPGLYVIKAYDTRKGLAVTKTLVKK